MALRGQRFELDLDADDCTPIPLPQKQEHTSSSPDLVSEIKERNPAAAPAPPKLKTSRTGFPEHRKRTNISAFKQQKARQDGQLLQTSQQHAGSSFQSLPPQTLPSDQEIAHRLGENHGYDFDAKEKAQISEENARKIAAMSDEDIEEARAEVMTNLNPALIEKLLKRANIDEDNPEQNRPSHTRPRVEEDQAHNEAIEGPDTHVTVGKSPVAAEEASYHSQSASQSEPPLEPSIHFPVAPRTVTSFVPLDPNSPAFLSDLKNHYFPDTPHDPSSLSWLQDPSMQENEESPYNPTRDNYSTGQLRFSFTGTIIPPAESLEIPVEKGLHHHGLAPSSAGYTIPELAILSRSTLPNQRCIAYQLLGRILFRLGRGDFGPRGSELQDGLWSVVERERVIEVMMSEANRTGGHASAKTYATEALWLWRRGNGGDRGLLKETERIAK